MLDLLVQYRGPVILRAAGKSGRSGGRRTIRATTRQSSAMQSSTHSPSRRSWFRVLKLRRTWCLVTLCSIPEVVIKTAAQILLAAGDFSGFKTPGHLAAYAGIAPATRRSETSIRGKFPSRASNKRLKNTLPQLARVASWHDPLSKAYCDQKRAEGKHHIAAVICLARCRLNVLFALVNHRAFYEQKTQLLLANECNGRQKTSRGRSPEKTSHD